MPKNYTMTDGTNVRFVHARRARKLRKRGVHVQFANWSDGHPIYWWSRATKSL